MKRLYTARPFSRSNGMLKKTTVLLVILLASAACKKDKTTVPGDADRALKELQITDVKEGTGKVATNGKTLRVQYAAFLLNDIKVDSSYDRGEPLEFRLGEGKVIKGWEKGLLGMKEGGVRELKVPADLAYGDRGAGGVIPPGAAMKFHIELLEVR